MFEFNFDLLKFCLRYDYTQLYIFYVPFILPTAILFKITFCIFKIINN